MCMCVHVCVYVYVCLCMCMYVFIYVRRLSAMVRSTPAFMVCRRLLKGTVRDDSMGGCVDDVSASHSMSRQTVRRGVE
uniref:Secreted protein n=1 Tax=Haemonchus contortus TaxID=6289 RepID=A0A7I4YVS0_HAECO